MTPEQLAALPAAVERLREYVDAELVPAYVSISSVDLRLVLEGLAMATVYITGGWSQEPLEIEDIATGKREIAVMCKGCIAVLAADEEGPIKHKKECFIPAFKQLAAALAKEKP